MGRPTADDPLGQRPDPADFGDMLNSVVDAKIHNALRGRLDKRFDDVLDQHLVLELVARGWAVFWPGPGKKGAQ